MIIAIPLLLFTLIGLNVPIFVSLAATTFAVFALFTSMPLDILPQRMFAGVEIFALLAIPFFMLAAQIMGQGGITRRLINLAETSVGHLPGGLGVCAVLSCLFFAAITGSTASTVVAVGGIMYPNLVKAGYGERFSLGLVTCSALLGMIVPPSNAMIIYGSITNVSVGALFMSGFGAASVFVLAYTAWCIVHARRTGLPTRPRADRKAVSSATREALWGLGLPIIILGGIYSGIFTPTESAAVAVVYSIIITVFVYRELRLADIWTICCETALISARILIMVAAATLFSWLLVVENLTTKLIAPIMALDLPPWGMMFFVNLFMLFAGMFIDVFSNILIICPLVKPLVQSAAVNDIHFGIITAVNADMGNITPPFGLNLFIASAAFGHSFFFVLRAVLPWLLLALCCLAVITYLPDISLWLPRRLYPGIG